MSEDWDEIGPRVLRASLNLARIYGWGEDRSLPKGKSVEGLVQEAISDLFSAPERRNEKVSLTVQLIGIVRSKLSNLARSPDENVERTDCLDDTALDDAEDTNEKVARSDLFSRAVELLGEHTRIKGKADHELVVYAMSEGHLDAEEIEQETGLERKRIYQVLREIKDVYPTIRRQLEGGE